MLLRRSADLTEYVARCVRPGRGRGALPRHPDHGDRVLPRTRDLCRAARACVFPAILEAKRDDDPLRIWVPGCASGEEAYSLAITALDVMARAAAATCRSRSSPPTSTSATRSARARHLRAKHLRTGRPRSSCGATSSPTDGGYQISKAVRDLCVFARHDVTADPPFPRLDLVSCRNLLIYLGPRAAAAGHRQPPLRVGGGGYLVLGRSESIAGSANLFDASTRSTRSSASCFSSVGSGHLDSAGAPARRARCRDPTTPSGGGVRWRPRRSIERSRAGRQGPVGRVCAGGSHGRCEYGIVEFRGDTAPYLANRPGRASLNLLDMVRDDLAGKVRAALAEAAQTRAKVTREGIHLGNGKLAARSTFTSFRSTPQRRDALPRPLRGGRPPRGRGGRRGRVGAQAATEVGEVQRLRDELMRHGSASRP